MSEEQKIEEGAVKNNFNEEQKTNWQADEEDEKIKNRGAKWKFVLGFFGMIVLVLGGLFSWKAYEQKVGERKVQALAEALQKAAEDDYNRAMADTYGGKTPQETLRMYIEAVEKGDYELASRYLIEEKRAEEIQNLEALNEKNNSGVFIGIIKKAEPWRSSLSDTTFTMESKISRQPSYFIEFAKFPNGIWKIIKI